MVYQFDYEIPVSTPKATAKDPQIDPAHWQNRPSSYWLPDGASDLYIGKEFRVRGDWGVLNVVRVLSRAPGKDGRVDRRSPAARVVEDAGRQFRASGMGDHQTPRQAWGERDDVGATSDKGMSNLCA